MKHYSLVSANPNFAFSLSLLGFVFVLSITLKSEFLCYVEKPIFSEGGSVRYILFDTRKQVQVVT